MSTLRRHIRAFLESSWALGVVLLFAFACLMFQLTEAPPTWYDEGMVVQLALNLAQYGHIGTQIAPDTFVSGAYTSTGLPLVAPVAASFLLFGHTLFAARMVMVAFALILITLAYTFVRRAAGAHAALGAAALLATFSTFYGDGKNVLGEVPGLCFLMLFLMYARKLMDEHAHTTGNALLAGLFLGLCVATKPTFLVLLGAAGIAFLYTVWREGKLPPLSVLGWGALGLVLPVAAWLLTQFDSADSLSRVLSFYGNPYRLPDLSSVMAQNALRFLTETTPLYLAGVIGVWALSLASELRQRARISYAELTAFLFSLLIIAAYLRTPGWYRYLFAAQITATVFLPVALARLSHVRLLIKQGEHRRRIAYGIVVVLLALQTYVLFFDSWIRNYAASTNTAEAEAYFSTQSATTTWFMYDVPEAVLLLPEHAPYYQYIAVNGEGYWGIGGDERALIASSTPDRIVASEGEDAALFPHYTESARAGKFVVFERNSRR